MISHKLAWIFSIGTFVFAMFADSWLNLWRALPTVEVDNTQRIPDKSSSLNGRIQVELITTLYHFDRDDREAVFWITNGFREPIYYSGDFEDNPAQVWVRQAGTIQDSVKLNCWRGVGNRTIEPGQTVEFTVPIPPKGGYFDVGFDFRMGLRAGWETVWFRFPEYPNR